MTAGNEQASTNPFDKSPDLGQELSAELNAVLEKSLEKMPKAPAEGKDAKGDAADATHSHQRPGFRGPRVVQAGREHRHGKVVSIGPTDIFIEFGPKELGVLPRAQFTDESQLPKVGDDYEAVIDKFEATENYFVCSRPGAVTKAAWEMLEAGQTVEARVTGVVAGKDGKPAGLELEVAGHRAFMPASQASLDRAADLSVFVGEKMTCQVSRVERMGKGNIVLTRRDLLQQERKEQAEKLRASLAEGQTIEGTVRKVMPFGCFVDIGGLDGLVHISDLTYDRVGFGEKAVQKYVSEGQRVKVRVLKIDTEQNRIALGMKQVAGDPFVAATESITEGGEVTGKVVRITEFGAFIELGPGVDGLVHISEIDHKRINKVEEALKVDEIVRAKVLKLDQGTRRISLSIKALKQRPEAPPTPEGGQGEKGAGGGPGRGGFGGKPGKRDREFQGRTAEEILKETPALRRAREKHKQFQFKGGLS
jgi:small subunit ribosomal protein S1